MTLRAAVWITTAGLAWGAGLASAQNMRAGLWESTTSMKSQSGQMEDAMKQAQQQLASLPPDQRRMVEQMMAQQGVRMGPQGNTVRTCLSKEQAERMDLPAAQDGCTQEVLSRGGSSIRIKFQCAGPPPAHGEGEFKMQGPQAYTGRVEVNSQIQGRPDKVTMEHSGRWLSDDCGGLKPLTAPRR